jgi:hypothetical protein
MTQSKSKLTLIEVLAKTTYQVQITKSSNKEFDRPIAFGSGFLVNYKNELIFVTADHNIHIEDYELYERTGIDNVASIFNNISKKEEFSTLLTPVGPFYYMEKFDITKPNEKPELFDVAICLMNKEKIEAPFLTEQINDHNGNVLVQPNEPKFTFSEEQMVEATTNDHYFIYGKIKPEIRTVFLHRIDTMKENITFIQQSGDYLLFNTNEIITDGKDWSGLSGSAVLNQEGNCVGVLCSINEGTKSIWVKSIQKVKVLMDVAILQEQLANEKSTTGNNVYKK